MKDTQNMAGELLLTLQKKGITFYLENGKLKFKDTKGNFTEEYKEKVKAHKKEILRILKKEESQIDFVTGKKDAITLYPLTDVQTAYLIGKTEAVEWGGVDCKGYIEVNFGTHSVQEISEAWEALVNRHDMLRAKVNENGFEILKRHEIEYTIEILDMQAMKNNEEIDKLAAIRNEFSKYKFNMENVPLFKAMITKRKDGNYFHLLVDLIISDFASVQILMSDMSEILKGNTLSIIPIKFTDYALFKQNIKGSLRWHRDREYWMTRLDKIYEAPNLPRDGRAADNCENPYGFYHLQQNIDRKLWMCIKEASKNYGVTVSAVLITIYAETIARWSENKRFTINLPIQSRPNEVKGINTVVGDFTSVNLLSVNMDYDASFIEKVRNISRQLFDDLEHSDFSGIEVLRELSKNSDYHNSMMPIVFTGVLDSKKDVGIIEFGFSHTPQVWIDCQVVEQMYNEKNMDKGLMISWDCRKGAIKKSIIEDMFASFVETVKKIGRNTQAWEKEIEVQTSLRDCVKISCEPVNEKDKKTFIHRGFIEYAKKRPESIAVIDATGKVSYGQMLENAEYIAAYLREKYGKHDKGLVAIKMNKSAKQITAVMGILIAGFTYLPLDLKQPLARQKKILEKAYVIAELDEKTVDSILENASYRLEEQFESNNPIAYVIYTSGSTGEPKGVVVSHAAANNTLSAIKRLYNINAEDRVIGIAELSFDLSVFDVFGILGVGGMLVLPDPEKGPDASHWGELINRYNITIWNTVPAQAEMLEAYSTACLEKYSSIRTVFLSGDLINTSLPARLRKIMCNAQIVSLGGATEGGIWSIYHEIGEEKESPTILYGKALPGQWMGVLDDKLRPCPQYVSGEIVIGGYSLAEGYLDDKLLTEKKFVYFNEGKERIYLTGDKGRYVEEGNIEFLGRLDNQIKINGHRIEIAEVENAIREIPAVEDCCVIYIKSEEKTKLVAFVKERKESIENIIQAEKAKKKLDSDTIISFNKFLETAICDTVYKKITKLFIDKPQLSLYEIKESIGVQPQYEELLKRWLEILEKHGYLCKEKKSYMLSDRKIEVDANWEKICSAPYSDIAPKLVSKYIRKHAESIDDLLKGEINPLIFLFPEGNTQIAESLYGDTAIAQFLNESIGKIVRAYIEKNGKTRILEVGGGIGATTKKIMREIDGLEYDYLFTDVSIFFLNNIKKKYSEKIKTSLLNLDEWEPKEFEKYDVIVAAGVLNNTKNIIKTLEKLNEMLNERGVLLITEPVEEHIEITVSQAFMMPKHTDIREKTGHCFLSENEWIDAFNSVGLEAIHIFPEKNDEYIYFKQDLFIVRKKQVDYREYLEDILPRAMIPTEFISIDEIPLSTNGKIDRYTLKRIAEKNNEELKESVAISRELNQEVHSKIENDILQIMVDVSGNSNISYNDNLLNKGFDSLLLSQASGKIVNKIPEAQELRFDEILRAALKTPTISEISEYIGSRKESTSMQAFEEKESLLRAHKVSSRIVYVVENEKQIWTNTLIGAMEDADILIKNIAGSSLKEEVDFEQKREALYLIVAQNVSEVLVQASELLAQGICFKKVFLLEPEKANINDLYLGDIVIINGSQRVIDSWENAVIGNVTNYETSTDDICEIIIKELTDEK